MTELFSLIPGAALVNNLVLGQLLAATTTVAVASHFERVLMPGLRISLVLILTTAIAAVLQLPAPVLFLPCLLPSLWLVHKLLPGAGKGEILLTAGNTGILGALVLINTGSPGLLPVLLTAAGTALGFLLVLLLLSAMQDRLQSNAIPAPFRGSAIVLVTVGIMAMAFLGFAGIV